MSTVKVQCKMRRTSEGKQNCSIFGFITKICLYSFDPIKPYFYKVQLGFTGVYIIFLISAQKHRLWYSLEPPRRVPTIYV